MQKPSRGRTSSRTVWSAYQTARVPSAALATNPGLVNVVPTDVRVSSHASTATMRALRRLANSLASPYPRSAPGVTNRPAHPNPEDRRRHPEHGCTSSDVPPLTTAPRISHRRTGTGSNNHRPTLWVERVESPAERVLLPCRPAKLQFVYTYPRYPKHSLTVVLVIFTAPDADGLVVHLNGKAVTEVPCQRSTRSRSALADGVRLPLRFNDVR